MCLLAEQSLSSEAESCDLLEHTLGEYLSLSLSENPGA